MPKKVVTVNSARRKREALNAKKNAESKAQNILQCKDTCEFDISTVRQLKAELDTQNNLEAGLAEVPCDDIMAETKEKLKKLEEKHEDVTEQKTEFADEHSLDRDPDQPHKVLNTLLLLIMMFGEAIVNAGFFLSAHLAAGPFGALLISLLISLCNVAFSACAGYVIGPRLKYGSAALNPDMEAYQKERVFAHKALKWYLVIIGFFHLIVGHIRSTESLDKLNISISSIGEMLLTPEAVFLIMLGVCMSYIAFRKGHLGFDDPYFGYGVYGRELQRIEEDIDTLHDEACEDIEERFDLRLEEIVELSDRAEEKVEHYNRAVEKARTSLETLKSASGSSREGIPEHLAKDLKSFQQGIALPECAAMPDHSNLRFKLELKKSESLEALSDLFNTTPNRSTDEV